MTTDSMMAAVATEPSAAPYNAQLDPEGAFLLGPSTDEPCPGPGPKPKNPKKPKTKMPCPIFSYRLP